jgi:hypothetical protein
MRFAVIVMSRRITKFSITRRRRKWLTSSRKPGRRVPGWRSPDPAREPANWISAVPGSVPGKPIMQQGMALRRAGDARA